MGRLSASTGHDEIAAERGTSKSRTGKPKPFTLAENGQDKKRGNQRADLGLGEGQPFVQQKRRKKICKKKRNLTAKVETP